MKRVFKCPPEAVRNNDCKDCRYVNNTKCEMKKLRDFIDKWSCNEFGDKITVILERAKNRRAK